MRTLVICCCFWLFSFAAKAQNSNFEVKIISERYASVKGLLKKVSAEGIGIEDYKGNYLIFRPNEITRIKIRKRGLTIGEGTLNGTIAGAGTGLILMSLDEEGDNFGELLVASAILTGSGAVLGTLTGIICEIINTKKIFRINGDKEKFDLIYQKLVPYINQTVTEHFN